MSTVGKITPAILTCFKVVWGKSFLRFPCLISVSTALNYILLIFCDHCLTLLQVLQPVSFSLTFNNPTNHRWFLKDFHKEAANHSQHHKD